MFEHRTKHESVEKTRAKSSGTCTVKGGVSICQASHTVAAGSGDRLALSGLYTLKDGAPLQVVWSMA